MSRASTRRALLRAFERLELDGPELDAVVETIMDHGSPDVEGCLSRIEIRLGGIEWTQRLIALLLLGALWLLFRAGERLAAFEQILRSFVTGRPAAREAVSMRSGNAHGLELR